MAETLFLATARFGPADGEAWQSYCARAQIPGLREIVSLDCMLCRRLIREFHEDWLHNVQADCRLDYFRDLDYLMHRVEGRHPRNLLGLYRNPPIHIEQPPASRDFSFVGYDLIEEATQVSALCNCGGFPEVFANEELNSSGLVTRFERASEIHRRLPQQHPDEPHARCELYAVWRLNESDT